MNDGTTIRELSSVGSERLPYKQRVGGSTPSAPTKKASSSLLKRPFLCISNPVIMVSRIFGINPQKTDQVLKYVLTNVRGKTNVRFW